EPAGMTTIGLSYSLVKISTKCAPALSSDGRYSYSFNSLARECSKRMRDLTEDENALLAEKELSLLERRLVTYKNLVELAVHLD
ncbi:hypothetical protein ACK36T_19065, partial [Aeromonas veronii]